MDAILTNFYADPLQYIGLVFAFVACIGLILFVIGFFAGLPHLFTLSSNDDHQKHHRHRIVWGTMLLYWTFIVWECVRIVAGWFGYQYVGNTSVFETFVVVLLIICAILWVMFKVKDTVTSDAGH